MESHMGRCVNSASSAVIEVGSEANCSSRDTCTGGEVGVAGTNSSSIVECLLPVALNGSVRGTVLCQGAQGILRNEQLEIAVFIS